MPKEIDFPAGIVTGSNLYSLPFAHA